MKGNDEMKKIIVTLSILCILLLVTLLYILNTTYSIEINGITYNQKIIDYILEKN